DHGPRPQGGEGPRRGRSQDREGSRSEGRRRGDEEEADRGRREGGAQVELRAGRASVRLAAAARAFVPSPLWAFLSVLDSSPRGPNRRFVFHQPNAPTSSARAHVERARRERPGPDGATRAVLAYDSRVNSTRVGGDADAAGPAELGAVELPGPQVL